MVKKFFIMLFALLLGLLLVACEEETTTTTTTEFETTTTTEGFVLPDLEGLNESEARNLFSGSSVTLDVVYEANASVTNGTFVRYGDDFLAGNSVSNQATITLFFAMALLPDLTDMTKADIRDTLDNLALNYEFQYITNTDYDEDEFIDYGGNDDVGTEIRDNHTIIVQIATSKLVLPDLSGMNQTDIINALFAANISFVIEVITDNSVPDQTFSGYGDGFEAGDLVRSSYTVTVYIGFNSATLPDLTGMIKEQIISVLNTENINYVFNYIVNDAFAEDTFAGYQDANIGDIYEEGIVTVNLYQNTFTNSSESLIISKYVDGGIDTSDQAIELYNPTSQPIDLSLYHLAIYSNGAYTPTYIIPLTEMMLGVGETFVIAHSDANANILSKADLTSGDLVFNGNDTIQVRFENGTYIDTIYNIGNKDFIMDDEIFVRSAEVVTGTRTYVFNQWHGFVSTYVEVLGTHPITLPTEMEFVYIDRDFFNLEGGMDLVTYASIADGDTAYFYPNFLGDERVRFLGVDTTETTSSEDWSAEAREYTRTILLAAEQIYIQSDPEMGFRGGYGRPLGLVWVNLGDQELVIDILSSDGVVMRTEVLTGWVLVNYHLVLNGFSYNYYGTDSLLVFNNRYIYRWFYEAELFAQEQGLGIHE